MRNIISRILLSFLTLIGVISIITFAVKAEALEPKLLWEKEFKHNIESVDLATETGDVILSLDKKEIILLDKNGIEKFHWGPRIDRIVGGTQISKDGNYFVFYSGYTEKYAEKKKLRGWADDRIHFYNSKTKKELWNLKSPESVALILPDGSSVVNHFEGGFEIINSSGKKSFDYPQKKWSAFSFIISSDSNYFAVIGDHMQPLTLFKRDGTKLWEKGRHNAIASISEGASYISTYPYSLGRSYVADSLSTHKGIVYDKSGNKILEGLGIVAGNGTRVVMYSPEKITIINLPDKTILKEIPIQINLPKISNPFFAVFSHDGRYVVVRSESTIIVFDLEEGSKKEVSVSEWRYVWLTRDGRYLLVRGNNKIYYYQLY